MAEWLNAPVLKTGSHNWLVGSNPTCVAKGVIMITVGEYVKKILKARNMTQIDLVKEINRRHLGYNGNDVKKTKINNFLNGTWHKNYPMARRCEIALDLPKYSLIKMIGEPTKVEWKRIAEVDDNV